MAKLIYSAITSLDGYTEDEDGNFDWAAPDHEVHQYVNDAERAIGTYLYGRRMYEVMQFWQSPPLDPDEPIFNDYAQIWQGADKIVYSTTLTEPATPRTRIESTFEPDAVRKLKDDASTDLGIGGPALAAHALRAGLVDEIHLYVNPVIVGGGRSALPDGLRVELSLVTEHRFTSGVVHLGYAVNARS